jgi:pimeloyl-ACP methyl ester carboxylesterase
LFERDKQFVPCRLTLRAAGGHDGRMPIAGVNGLELYYDTFGEAADPTILFVAGLGSQCVNFDEELCNGFVQSEFHVVRYDNRDVGLSTHLGPDSAYTLSDMAADGMGLLDQLGIDRAHVFGTSLGGMIAQTMAIEHPQRLRSLTSVMSNTGEVGFGFPEPEMYEPLLELAAPVSTRDEAIEQGLALGRLTGSPEMFDENWHRRRQIAFYDRCYDPAGVSRQIAAVVASGARDEGLRALAVPTLVIHGASDPLVPPSGGRRTAELIPDAEYIEVDGMGHDLPPVMWPRYVAWLTDFVAGLDTTTEQRK